MIRALLSSAILASALGAATVVSAESPSASTAATADVPFETLGIVSDTLGINLWPPALLRVRSDADIEEIRQLMTGGTDGTFARRVVDAIGDIPDGRVVLIGVIDTSCTPATAAGLVRAKDGRHLAMFAPGHVPEPIECFVAVVTVAVLSVEAADAPPGSTDFAEPVAFEFVGYEPPAGASAVELTSGRDALDSILPGDVEVPSLPSLADGHRRFAFLRPGCQNSTAELMVTRSLVDARLDQPPSGDEIACVRAEWYLAVFDIQAEYVLDSAVVVGTTER